MKRMAVVAVTMAKCEIFADDSSKSNRKSNKLCSCRLRLSLSLSLFFLGAETNFFFKKIIIIKTPSIAYRFDTDRGSKYRTGPTAWTLRDRPKSFFFLKKKPKKNENVNVQNPSWSQQQPTAEIPSNTRPMASLLPKFDYLAIHVFFYTSIDMCFSLAWLVAVPRRVQGPSVENLMRIRPSRCETSNLIKIGSLIFFFF